jgi:hypothetical protein
MDRRSVDSVSTTAQTRSVNMSKRSGPNFSQLEWQISAKDQAQRKINRSRDKTSCSFPTPAPSQKDS